jgi:hypothetical protein
MFSILLIIATFLFLVLYPHDLLLSPDFGQIRKWAVREMGLEGYTWKISEAAW